MEIINVNRQNQTKSILWINVLSVIVPVVVAVLLGVPTKLDLGAWTKSLSHVIGAINSVTTVLLVAGLIFIRQNRINLHRVAMTAAFSLGALFLVAYVTYHLTNPANRYTGVGFSRYVYFFFLITHVALSLVVLPLVLRAMFFAVAGLYDRHRRIVRYAYPIWLYVSATGVIVYLMLYHL
jgi:putative membrane protein